MNNFYPQEYHDSTVKKLILDIVNEENKNLVERGKVVVLPDNLSNEIAFNNLDGEIGIQSMSTTTRMLQNASKVSMEDMEMFFAQQNSIMKTIIDHEIAHSLEPMNKIKGVQIYNNKILPKLMDGSLGIYDEESFEKHRDTLIDLMNSEFKKDYNPSDFEYNSFEVFTNDYFLPDAPFGMTNRIAMIDNYISDISIENFMAGIHSNPKIMDSQFKNLRDLLYSNNDNYSILRSMQIYIDPRYKDSKELEKVMGDEEFQKFLNINIDNLNISSEFYKASNPEQFEQMKMIAIMNELRESVRKIREYAYIRGAYFKYKDEKLEKEKNKLENEGVITLEDINKRSTKLAKVVYIKELEGNMENEGLINQIIKNDDMIGKNGFNYQISENVVKKSSPFYIQKKDNSNEEDSSTKGEQTQEILPKMTYMDTINYIGHNKDFATDLNNMYIEIRELIKNNLELKHFQSKFDLEDKEVLFVNKVLQKEVKEDYYFNDNNLINKRENLIEELKNSDYYYTLKNKVSKIEENLNEASNKIFYTKEENDTKKVINIFIEDNLDSKNKNIDKNYNALDYQIANAMIIKELFENSSNVSVNILNIGNENTSLSYIYDSSFNKDKEIENSKILSIDGVKEENLNKDNLLEAIVKLKSIEGDTEMVNLILYNHDNINFLDNKNLKKNQIENISNNNIFIDINNIKENELTKILSYSLEESLKTQELNQNSI